MVTEEPLRCGECGGELVVRCTDCGTRHGGRDAIEQTDVTTADLLEIQEQVRPGWRP